MYLPGEGPVYTVWRDEGCDSYGSRVCEQLGNLSGHEDDELIGHGNDNAPRLSDGYSRSSTFRRTPDLYSSQIGHYRRRDGRRICVGGGDAVPMRTRWLTNRSLFVRITSMVI